MPDPAATDGLYRASFAAAIAFIVGLVAPAATRLRVFWYYPTEHRWAFRLAPLAGLAMDFYGRCLDGLLAAFVVFAVALAIGRRRPLSDRAAIGWALWTGATVVLALLFFTYQIAFRRPVPAPLPPGYLAR